MKNRKIAELKKGRFFKIKKKKLIFNSIGLMQSILCGRQYEL